MPHPFSPPPIQPLDRLQVTDGLLINADRWRISHDYHRQRQGIHYQSLHQPGIVCGLGICLISAPLDVPSQYRDGRWVQLQPGIAIDVAGNPIVVPKAMDFRITSEAPPDSPITVYLVVSYVDPTKLRRKEQPEVVQETFRIDEKINSPQEQEVEICRILLQPDVTQLQSPTNIFFPEANQLDLRHRVQVCPRPQMTVRVAQISYDGSNPSAPDHPVQSLFYLLESIASLYPALQGVPDIGQLTLDAVGAEPIADTYDVLYLCGQRPLVPTEAEFIALKEYLTKGGTLLVDAGLSGIDLAKSILELAQQLDSPLEPLENLSRSHPLRTQPFLFAALPKFQQEPTQVWSGGGILLIMGGLSSAWGLDAALSLPRETLRTAHELGINLLQFACRRRHLMQLVYQEKPPSTAQTPLQSMFNKLIG